MKVTSTVEKFVRHWGEMGTRWGINRTVAQVHALLYVSADPIHAEDIVDALGVARSNVSTSVKELQGWGLVRVVHLKGDRRDHFVTQHDVWEMFRIITEERKKREFDPAQQLLAECVAEAKEQGETVVHKRLTALYDFFVITGRFYDQIRSMPGKAMVDFLRFGGKIRKLLGLA